jgi:dTDP-4-amino-4,6-dideoxygalactose transaminase
MPPRIDVTAPSLAPLAEFLPYLEQIWASRRLSNDGPFHIELEAAVAAYLGVEHVALLSNGTSALLLALAALELQGEVVTTPFSFVASSHALRWAGLEPVFADIDPLTLNIDPASVEAAITPRTSAILAVHTYGPPCDVVALRDIAHRHGLRLIYDAAHSFGVNDAGGSILRHGDLSVLSFHATKVFSTLEGGAIVCRDAGMKRRIDRLKNFGLDGDAPVGDIGINAKMNELQAAFGLMQLKHLDAAIRSRAALDARYRHWLRRLPGIVLPPSAPGITPNHAYFPILVTPAHGETRDQIQARLAESNIHARRYFFPLISNMPAYSALPSSSPSRLPVANLRAAQVLCLPLSPDLGVEQVDRIAALIGADIHKEAA